MCYLVTIFSDFLHIFSPFSTCSCSFLMTTSLCTVSSCTLNTSECSFWVRSSSDRMTYSFLSNSLSLLSMSVTCFLLSNHRRQHHPPATSLPVSRIASLLVLLWKTSLCFLALHLHSCPLADFHFHLHLLPFPLLVSSWTSQTSTSLCWHWRRTAVTFSSVFSTFMLSILRASPWSNHAQLHFRFVVLLFPNAPGFFPHTSQNWRDMKLGASQRWHTRLSLLFRLLVFPDHELDLSLV